MNWDGKERRDEGHFCKFEDRVIEMCGDIKTLVAEFKSMNGSLRNTKTNFEKHDDESDTFRTRVNILWYGLFYTGWIIVAVIALLHLLHYLNII